MRAGPSEILTLNEMHPGDHAKAVASTAAAMLAIIISMS